MAIPVPAPKLRDCFYEAAHSFPVPGKASNYAREYVDKLNFFGVSTTTAGHTTI